MTKILTFLKGKRTYICAIAGAIVVFLQFINIIDSHVATTLLALLGFGGMAALRAAK